MNRDVGPEVSEVTPDLVMQFASTWTYDPVVGGLNSLIQSGRLGILQEDSLRVALAGWPDIVTDLRENENEEWRFTFPVLNPLLVEIGLAEDLFGAAGRLRRIDLTSGAPDLRPLLSDPRFRHLCATRIMNLHDVLDEVRSVEESAQAILQLLDAP